MMRITANHMDPARRTRETVAPDGASIVGMATPLIARHRPEISCTVIELPGVLADGEEFIAELGVSERVATLPGDYHTTQLPKGHDAAILFGVLHQESRAASNGDYHYFGSAKCLGRIGKAFAEAMLEMDTK